MFKIRVDVYHHAGNGLGETATRILEELAAMRGATEAMAEGLDDMNLKLTAAIRALQEEVTDSTGKLESIRTYLQGVPSLVAAAVAQALADANVSEDEAATAIEEARQTASDAVDSTMLAIVTNPAEGESTADHAAAAGGATTTGVTDTTTVGPGDTETVAVGADEVGDLSTTMSGGDTATEAGPADAGEVTSG